MAAPKSLLYRKSGVTTSSGWSQCPASRSQISWPLTLASRAHLLASFFVLRRCLFNCLGSWRGLLKFFTFFFYFLFLPFPSLSLLMITAAIIEHLQLLKLGWFEFINVFAEFKKMTLYMWPLIFPAICAVKMPLLKQLGIFHTVLIVHTFCK